MQQIAIVGAGGFGREVKWLIDDINQLHPTWEVIGFFDDAFPSNQKIDSKLHLGSLQQLNQWPQVLAVVVAIGNSTIKQQIVQQITNKNIYFPVLQHPRAIVGKQQVSIGEGSIICANAIVTTDVIIGNHVALGVASTVGHDCTIHDFVSVMPSANISGNVTIGEAAYIGTGVNIIQQQNIGAEAIIGAGAVVVTSIPPKCTAVGVPAKPIKFH